MVEQLQAEVAALKALLAQQQPQQRLLSGQLLSRTWDSCSSSNSTAVMAEAADMAAADTGGAVHPSSSSSSNSRTRISGWANRLKVSISGGSAARSAAAAANRIHKVEPAETGSNQLPEGLEHQRQQAASATLSIASTSDTLNTTATRSSASNGSILWKFFHHVRAQSVDLVEPNIRGLVTSSSNGSNKYALTSNSNRSHSINTSPHGTLRSTGLLMLTTGAAAAAARIDAETSGSTSNGNAVSPSAAKASRLLRRWATSHTGSMATEAGAMSSSRGQHHWAASQQGQQQSSSSADLASRGLHSRSTAARASDCGILSREKHAQGQNIQQNGVSSSQAAVAAAAEAAIALRDHIIQQLVAALQQKKSEIRVLREQHAAAARQLEAAEQEGKAGKEKLRELAEGIQSVAAAREEEYDRWMGHLRGVEGALEAAQLESITYRQEALSLVQQLTRLQARYRTLQSDQLRKSSSLLYSASHTLLLSTTSTLPAHLLQQVSNMEWLRSGTSCVQICLGLLPWELSLPLGTSATPPVQIKVLRWQLNMWSGPVLPCMHRCLVLHRA
eukprot:GHRR01027630.1.p1 GENE.GHRR01027630.1~~GHRR01027630.1.p1  ORF type:complete len:644 (+),score=229.29 GHRR01027630.1:254-1933(+)